MKSGCNIILIFILALCMTECSLALDEVGLENSANVNGKYIWRGQNLVDEPVFQPGFSVSYKNFTAGIWGSLELTDINGNSGNFTEVDYSLNYSVNMPNFYDIRYSFGVVCYDFPGTPVNSTTELYWGLGFPLPMNPLVTFYHDVDEANGTYISLSFGHSIENIDKLSSGILIGLQISSAIGWGSCSYNNYYWGVDNDELNDLSVIVSLPIEIGGWEITPSFNYVTILSDGLRKIDQYSNNSDFFFASIGFTKGF